MMNQNVTKQFALASCLAVAALAPRFTLAATDAFTITVTNYGTISGVPISSQQAAKDALDTLFTTLSTQVNSELDAFPDLTDLNKGIGNSLVASGSGIGFDYSSNFDLFLAAVQAGVAMQSTVSPFQVVKDLTSSTGSLSDKLENLDGLGAQVALTVGLPIKNFTKAKIAFIDLAQMKGYLHFFNYKLNKSLSETDQIDFSLSSTAFGAGLQYKIVQPVSVGLGVVKWNGVDVQSGLKLSKMGLNVVKKDLTQAVSAGSGAISGATAQYVGDVSAGINATTFSIPFEASTSARLLYIFSFFAGLGGDFAVGSSNTAPASEGVITVNGGGIEGVSADGVLDMGGGSSPGFLNLRYFGGLQFDLSIVGLSVQYGGSLYNGTKSVNFSAKAYW
jgi:hypothetical protein